MNVKMRQIVISVALLSSSSAWCDKIVTPEQTEFEKLHQKKPFSPTLVGTRKDGKLYLQFMEGFQVWEDGSIRSPLKGGFIIKNGEVERVEKNGSVHLKSGLV